MNACRIAILHLAAASCALAPVAAGAAAPAPFRGGTVAMNTIVTGRIQPQAERLLVGLAKEGRGYRIDGVAVFNGSDKFLPGKIALGLVDFIAALPKDDPRLPGYLADFRKIARLTVDDANDSWGIYYYLTAIDRLRERGLLEQAFDRLTLAKLRVRLDWRSFVDTRNYALIDHPNNYYCVAFAIARLRAQQGWETREGADRLYAAMVTHYREYSGPFGFADETEGAGRFDRYSVLLAGEIAQRFLQTGEKPPAEVLGWLRKSADVMLQRVNLKGHGFEYGRSLGPYGETSIVEVLTAAAATGVLTKPELELAYAYSSSAAQHYVEFWTDAKTGSVNLWDGGRRTDAYRGKFRILGENLSLAHQFVYTNDWWNRLGYRDKAPTPDFDRLAAALPDRTTTWFAKGGYDRLLVTMRDRGRLVSLPVINGAESQHDHNPYFPIPFSPGMLEGVADGSAPLMVPQLKLADGTTLMPLAYFRNAKVQTRGKRTIVTFDQAELDRMGDRAPVPDRRIAVATRYEFAPGLIRRTDTFTPAAPVALAGMTLAFGTFSGMPSGSGTAVTFGEGDVRAFRTTGLSGCEASPVGDDPEYRAAIGAMRTRVVCRSGAQRADRPFTIGWELRYQ
ncbi:hypothetical protein [Sphingomonas sp. VNH70]|uniref:hypothetical protein n=1 Tax=Sphingomonas silueang TaxID=3156617 RepID=UPI0032B3A059